MDKEQLKIEEEYFSSTKKLIEKKLEELYITKKSLKDQVLETRRDMFENAPTAVSNFIDVAELTSYNASVQNSESAFERNEIEIKKLLKQQNSPYFARIDFESINSRRSQSAYIGIHSLRDDETFKLFVIDWRAPMASLYYNYDLGKGIFEVQDRKNEVNITLKRQFKIENGELDLVYDTNSSMHDEILGKALSENTENKLKLIIGSIQKEQNSAIRSDFKNSCLIYGLAGSGKTSVGLHRLAYILYHNRESLKAENILIISNNSIFSSYIAGVLPDLGEKPAETIVYHELLEQLGINSDIEDYYTQLSNIERNKNSKRLKNIKIKYSTEFLLFLKNHFEKLNFSIPQIKYKDDVIINEAIFNRKWSEKKFSSFKARYDLGKEIIKRSIDDFFYNNKERILKDIESESESYHSHRELVVAFRKLNQEYVSNALREIENINCLSPDMQLASLFEKFSGNEKEAERIYLSLQGGRVFYEDALLYLFVKILMGYKESIQSIKHVVIDEAQDYSPLQLFILKELYPKSTFTLLSDVTQAINPITCIEDYSEFDKIFGSDLNKIKLDKCYRSSSDINALAFSLLNEETAKNYSYFERKSKKPQFILSRDHSKSISEILKKLSNYNTTAIITSTKEEAEGIFRSIDKSYEPVLINTPESKMKGKLMIMPLVFSKGLEFDAVILIDSFKNNKNHSNKNKRIYLGATRALHELYFLESEKLSEDFEFLNTLIEIKED